LPAGGGVVGGRDVGGAEVGGALLVGGGVVPLTLPVQATPLSANDVGAVLLPLHEPLKPNETVALVPIAPL
jgi:hypothetical protein